MLKNGKSLDFKRFSGIEKAHRNSIEITVGFMAESKGFFRRTPVRLRVASLLVRFPLFIFANAKSRPCDLLFVLANNSNFDRNRVRGVQLRFGGGCSSRFEEVHYSTREDSNKPQALKPAVFSFLLGLKPRFLCRPGI